MSDLEAAVARALDLQQRICSVPPRNLPSLPPDLCYLVSNILADACDEDLLLGGSSRVWKTVKLHSSDVNEFVINLGGKDLKRNHKRTKEFPHFERADGAWFDFAVTARTDLKNPIEIIGYTFELRLNEVTWPSRPADERIPSHVRFDLNPEHHDNAKHGHRCHVHIGSDDFSMPSAWLSPLEILDLFIHGFMPRERE